MTPMISVNAVGRSWNPRFSWLRYAARKLPCMQVRTGNLYAELQQLRIKVDEPDLMTSHEA
jgi:hypothetical protein